MVKTKLRLFAFLLVFCILLVACVANSQQPTSGETRLETATRESKQELARAILVEAGVAKQYDLYLNNCLDIAFIPATSGSNRDRVWLHELLVREAGWAKIESEYVARLETDFSEAELRELLELAKQPIAQRLLQAEIAAYGDTAEARNRLVFSAWDRYNSGEFGSPPDSP